jgi:hypothetical protein
MRAIAVLSEPGNGEPGLTMGFFDVPTVERKPWGILGLILNIVPWGGVGSIVAGAKEGHKNTIIRGILQVVLTGIFIGWVWSVIDGVRIFKASSAGVAFTEVPAAKPAPAPAASSAAPKKAAAKKAPAKKAAAKKAK